MSSSTSTVPGGGCPWGSCGRIGPNPNGFWGSATYQNWVEDIWKKIATRYNGNRGGRLRPHQRALIDYNEDSDDVAQKSDYYNRLYTAVRAIDADHAIFLGAFFGLDKIAPPSTYGWTNVVYEYHPYDMPNSKDWTAQNQLVTNELGGLAAKLSNPGVPILYGEYPVLQRRRLGTVHGGTQRLAGVVVELVVQGQGLGRGRLRLLGHVLRRPQAGAGHQQ
jgi:hypothetical protein